MLSSQLRASRLGSRDDARTLRAGTAELSKTYDEIAALDPPHGYEKPFDAYVKANGRLVHDLNRFAHELGAGSERGLRQASRGVVAALGRSQSARLRWLE